MRRLLLLFLLSSSICSAQKHVADSLKLLIKNEKNDSIKIDLYNKLAWLYIFNDKEQARKTINEVEQVASKKGQEYGYNSFLNVKGVFYDVNGLSDSAKIMFERSLEFSRKNNFRIHEEHTLNNLGMFSWNKGKFKEALDYYFESLKLSEGEKGASKSDDGTYNNIGLIYQDMELYEKAIPYHNKALKLRKEKENMRGQATSYNNLGICYTNLKKYKEAERVLLKGKRIAESGRDKLLYYELVEALARLYASRDKIDQAIELYEESYQRPSSVPFNPNRKVSTLSGLAEMYLSKKKYSKVIDYGEQCLAIVKKDSSTDFLEVGIYNTLAQAYFATGDIEKGNFYNLRFYDKTSSKFKESTAEALQELETKYETQKKELALQKSQAKIKQKNMLIASSFGLAILLGLIGYLVYKQQRTRNEQIVKENQLRQALIKIENQNNLQEQRLAISKELHDNIGSQLTFIISSLDNLKQFDIEHQPMFDKIDTIGGFTRDTINDLRDTIWAMNKEEITVQDLKDRVTRFIDQAKASIQGVQFKFYYPEDADISMNSKLGIDVYRVIQEALNNAVKHANATEIQVAVSYLDDMLEVAIEDNGKGFDQEKVTDGYGIAGMRRRAEALQGTLDIVQLQPGLKVQLRFTPS